MDGRVAIRFICSNDTADEAVLLKRCWREAIPRERPEEAVQHNRYDEESLGAAVPQNHAVACGEPFCVKQDMHFS